MSLSLVWESKWRAEAAPLPDLNKKWAETFVGPTKVVA